MRSDLVAESNSSNAVWSDAGYCTRFEQFTPERRRDLELRQRIKIDAVVAQDKLFHAGGKVRAHAKARDIGQKFFESRPLVRIIRRIEQPLFKSEADDVGQDLLFELAGKIDGTAFDVMA